MSTGQKLANAVQTRARTGRPIKQARKGRRYRISVDISGPTKGLLVSRAKESGRTLAREAEMMIERAVAHDKALARSHRTLEELERGDVAAKLLWLGWTPTYPLNKETGKPYPKEGGGFWAVWAEPGYPGFSLTFSRFEPRTEAEGMAVRARLQEEAVMRARQEGRLEGEAIARARLQGPAKEELK